MLIILWCESCTHSVNAQRTGKEMVFTDGRLHAKLQPDVKSEQLTCNGSLFHSEVYLEDVSAKVETIATAILKEYCSRNIELMLCFF